VNQRRGRLEGDGHRRWAASPCSDDPGGDFDQALAGPTSSVLGLFDDNELAATVMVGHDGR
jgi:hypothetical protein